MLYLTHIFSEIESLTTLDLLYSGVSHPQNVLLEKGKNHQSYEQLLFVFNVILLIFSHLPTVMKQRRNPSEGLETTILPPSDTVAVPKYPPVLNLNTLYDIEVLTSRYNHCERYRCRYCQKVRFSNYSGNASTMKSETIWISPCIPRLEDLASKLVAITIAENNQIDSDNNKNTPIPTQNKNILHNSNSSRTDDIIQSLPHPIKEKILNTFFTDSTARRYLDDQTLIQLLSSSAQGEEGEHSQLLSRLDLSNLPKRRVTDRTIRYLIDHDWNQFKEIIINGFASFTTVSRIIYHHSAFLLMGFCYHLFFSSSL